MPIPDALFRPFQNYPLMLKQILIGRVATALVLMLHLNKSRCFLPSANVFFVCLFLTHSAQTSVRQEDGGRKVPEHRILVRQRRQTVAEQAECASTASTTSLHPAVTPQFRPCANSLRACKEGFAVYTVLNEASAVHERVSAWMNGPVGPAGVKRVVCEPFIFILMTRLSVGPTLIVLHSSEKGNMSFFFLPSECVSAGVALFHWSHPSSSASFHLL